MKDKRKSIGLIVIDEFHCVETLFIFFLLIYNTVYFKSLKGTLFGIGIVSGLTISKSVI